MNPKKQKNSKVFCQISQKMLPLSEAIPVAAIQSNIQKLIQNDFPQWTGDGYASLHAIQPYRIKHVRQLLHTENQTITELEKGVLKSLSDKEVLSQKLRTDLEELTLGQRLADSPSWSCRGVRGTGRGRSR